MPRAIEDSVLFIDSHHHQSSIIMPTFASIGLHPQLISQLVTVSSGSNNNTNDSNTSNSASGEQPPPQPSRNSVNSNSIVVIETPQALLSRNPHSIRLLVNNKNDKNDKNDDNHEEESYSTTTTTQILSPVHVNSLRRQVAQRLIDGDESSSSSSLSFGKHARHVRQTVLHDHDSKTNDNARKRQRQMAAAPILPGTVSLLHLLQYQKLLQQQQDDGQQSRFVFSTACPALDGMLGLPPEFNQNHHQLYPDDNPSTIGSGGGIPLGYVTQFSGASGTGKTQLALQLIVQAAAAAVATSASAVATPANTSTSTACCWYFCSNATEPLALARRLAGLLATTTTTTTAAAAGQQPGNNNMMTQVLKNTIFQTVTDEYQLLAGLAKMEETLWQQRRKEQERSRRPHHLLLIIDSISTCLSSSCCTMENPLVPKVALTLKRLARQFSNLAVVLLNGSTNTGGGSGGNSSRRQPALGTLWNNLAPDIHVWLEPCRRRSAVHQENHRDARTTNDKQASQLPHQEAVLIRARLERHFAKQTTTGAGTASAKLDNGMEEDDVDDDDAASYFCIANNGVKQRSFR
jgi:RecA/RadA recombinase